MTAAGVESYLPMRALEVVKAAEESERKGLRMLGEHLAERGIDEFMRQAS